MKQDYNSNNIMKILKSFFTKEKSILFCYLFGSYAYGNYNSKSDIDMAVFLDEKECRDFFRFRLEMMAKLSKLLKKEADIVVLNDLSSVFFKYVILREGKLIGANDIEKMIEFEAKVLRDYYDYSVFSKEYNKHYIERYLKA